MKYSIITVNYNNKEGLRKTIESVIHQSFRDFEFIVIDGGSTDGSAEVLKEYDKDISYWVSEKDNGIYNGMNKGIARAKGDYLNFMNSGDIFYNNNVLQQVEELHLTQDIIIGRDYHFNEETHQGFATILPTRISMVTLYMQALPHQSTFYKRTLFDKYYYDESLKLVADHKFNIQKICIEGHSTILLDVIICQREPDGASNQHQNISNQESKLVLTEFLPKGAIKDYDTLSLLGKSTVYKLMNECENEKARKLLIFCIKVINRIMKCS